MNILFESRPEIVGTTGKLLTVQFKPSLLEDPVMVGSSAMDQGGCSIYGTVLHDGGLYRMWYQAWPADWDGQDVALVGYAESDDGFCWRKPALDLPGADTEANICNLGFHSPSVFVDPSAAASHRYRATGFTGQRYRGAAAGATLRGYYTAHSADGLFWTLDGETPTWDGGDVITSVYHPQWHRATVMLKQTPRFAGIQRRSIWEAERGADGWSRPRAALLPDDFDDVTAATRGYASGDYYGMGMLAAGDGMVGFLWNFRHSLPRTPATGLGIFGSVDVSLVYQPGPGERWLHQAGRPDFIAHGGFPWMAGGVYTASSPVAIDGHQVLYITGTPRTHAWYMDETWTVLEARRQQMLANSRASIGVALWPAFRLFGFRADPHGQIAIDLGLLGGPAELDLNYVAEPGGSIRVALESDGASVVDRGLNDSLPLTGDATAETVHWSTGTTIRPIARRGRLVARLELDRATLYAFDLRELDR